MRKAARTVKPNARTGERHTWKDRERRRKEEGQRMAAEALIVEDAYQRGYADAIADMRKKKEQRRQREQAKKARRWYFIKQKAYYIRKEYTEVSELHKGSEQPVIIQQVPQAGQQGTDDGKGKEPTEGEPKEPPDDGKQKEGVNNAS